MLPVQQKLTDLEYKSDSIIIPGFLNIFYELKSIIIYSPGALSMRISM